MLTRFRHAKEFEIEALGHLEAQGRLPAPWKGGRPSFAGALRAPQPTGRCAVIAEYKRASPSRGPINMSISPEEAAAMYAGGGAAAISCLTEAHFFHGSLDYIALMACCGLPILRKDFLFDRRQLIATAATPASALLLIARMFPTAAELAGFVEQAAALGLDPVVEIFNEADLDMARAAGAAIIQVNTRDLDTLAVDSGNAVRLIARKGPGETWICASGIRSAQDVAAMAALGYHAVLVGTALMEAKDPGARLAELTGRPHPLKPATEYGP